MGMTAHEYWDDDPWLVKAYREAYRIKQEEQNTYLWLQGLYNYIGVATALNNGFNNRKEKYPEKPFDLFQEEKKREETPEEIRERYYQRLKQMQTMWERQHTEERVDG